MLDGGTEAEILGGGPADADLIAAYRDGHAALVAALRDADQDLECATFMPAPSPLAFWARRQAHETAIHRLDAQSAGRPGPPDPLGAFDPAFAADGIDELIMGFAARRRYRLTDAGEVSLAVRARDTGGAWHVAIADSATEVSRGEATADCVLQGTSAGLYAFLWNRSDGRGGRRHHHRRSRRPGRLERQRPRPVVVPWRPARDRRPRPITRYGETTSGASRRR